MKHKLVAISALTLLCSTFNAYAACPKSVAGSYVVYGNKASPSIVSARGGLITFGAMTNNTGVISSQIFIYNEISTNSGSTVTGELDLFQTGPKYTYDGKCYGYVWQPADSDSSKLEVSFFFVSDSGAQIVVIDGPTDVVKNSAGNPITPLPTSWQTEIGDVGVVTLRKQ
jgi:hypothetical protein